MTAPGETLQSAKTGVAGSAHPNTTATRKSHDFEYFIRSPKSLFASKVSQPRRSSSLFSVETFVDEWAAAIGRARPFARRAAPMSGNKHTFMRISFLRSGVELPFGKLSQSPQAVMRL